MGRLYAVKNAFTTLTAANGNIDWLELAPASNKDCILRGWRFSQRSIVGDTAETVVSFRVLRLTATVTSGSGGVTPSVETQFETERGLQGFTVEGFNPTVATTSGSTRELDEFGWNLRYTPFEFWYPDAAYCPGVKNAESLFIRQDSTLPSSIDCAATFWIEEMG